MMKTLMKTLLPLILLISATDLIHAQRDGGVQASIRVAVEAGEISQEQAEAMISAMRKTATKKDEKVGRRLREAVAAGDLTEEQARAMYETYGATKKAPRAERKKDSNQKPRGEDRMAIFRERLGEAVRSGEMTRAEAGEKMAAAQKRMQQNSDGDQARAERPRGKKGQERGSRAERKKDSNQEPRAEAERYYRERLGEAIRSGEMTRAEAGEKMAAAQKRMQQNSDGDQARAERPRGKKGQERGSRAERKKDSNQKPRGEDRMAIFRERLGEAVRSGEMTRAEAGEKMAAAQKRMQQNSDGDQARAERPRGEKGQERGSRAERKKNAGKKEGKKSTCENCGVQKQRQ